MEFLGCNSHVPVHVHRVSAYIISVSFHQVQIKIGKESITMTEAYENGTGCRRACKLHVDVESIYIISVHVQRTCTCTVYLIGSRK